MLIINSTFANEKFVKVKGVMHDHSTPVTNFFVKIILDDLDSSLASFQKDKFDVWLPANRRAKVIFIKSGYQSTHIIVDASFIPSFAYKKKQIIDLKVEMIKSNKKKSLKPFCVATFKSSEIKFILKYSASPNKNKRVMFRPQFPTALSVFKGAKPNNKYLDPISEYNKKNTDKESPYFKLLQGVIFANLNYTVFNEQIGEANKFLIKLSDIDKKEWSNLKPFDTPEYAAIVLKTVHNQKSADTLFALGTWIGTSQLLFQSFSSSSKVIIHGKKLNYALKKYKNTDLNQTQVEVIQGLNNIVVYYQDLLDIYMKAMKNKTALNLKENEVFLKIKKENNKLYNMIIN